MWMELEGIMLSEMSHTEKDKYCMISFLYGIEKKKPKPESSNSQMQRTDWQLPCVGQREMGKGSKVKASIYKISNPGGVMYSMVTVVINTVLYI